MKETYKIVEAASLKFEEGAHELFDSPEMEPYRRYLTAMMTGENTASAVAAIRDLPVEKRYLWRISSALKWGFADFDTVNVDIDRRTLEPEDLGKAMRLLRFRPIQFCMLLTALAGPEAMERTMLSAIAQAKQL